MSSLARSRYQLQTRWKITGVLTTRSPLHIGNGETTTHPDLSNASTDTPNQVAAIERNHGGSPMIPSSALKGVLRGWADRHYPAQAAAIARIFGDLDSGAPNARAGFAEFGPATLIAPSSDQLTQFEKYLPYWRREQRTGILSHVCIDRHNGTAEGEKLFFEEFLPEGVSFRVEIFAERLTDVDIQLLLAILEHGAAHDTAPLQFGANGANGWGRVIWNLDRVERADPTGVQFDAASVSFQQTWLSANLSAMSAPTTELSVLTIPVSLQCRGAFLVNDTSRTHRTDNDGLPHFIPLRRADGSVWLPASSFRGVLRQRAEFILRSLDPDATGNPNRALQDSGAIERIFGTTGRASRLMIEEFSGTRIGDSMPRQDFVAIDRFTGGAADGALFNARYADQPTVTSRLHLDTDGLSHAELALLAAALRDVMRGDVCFGFGGSRGYGEFRGTWDPASEMWVKEQLKYLPAPKLQPAVPQAAEPTVSEPISGKLVYQDTKAGKVRRIIFPTKKGPSIPTYFKESLLSPSLLADKTPEIEVEFDGLPPNDLKQIRRREERATVAKHALDAAQVKDKFAHAYYFLRQEDRKANWVHDFADREPVGHDRYHEGYFSGKIRVCLKTKTPLLICDDTTREETSPGHFKYDMRVDAYGKPVLHSSSFRGMLRAAYEAITNSRFGVFPGEAADGTNAARQHGRRLGFRLPAQSGLATVPARIFRRPSGELAVQLLPGTSTIQPSSNRNPVKPVYAAWCGHYAGHNPPGLNGHRHRAEVWAYLTPWSYRRTIPGRRPTQFDFWNVEEIRPNSPIKPADTPVRRVSSSRNATIASWGTSDWYRGYLCITLNNMNGKHDERFFFQPSSHDSKSTDVIESDLTQIVINQWRELIQDYHDQHQRDLENGLAGPPILGNGRHVFSRHISIELGRVNEAEIELHEGDLCYAEVSKSSGYWHVQALYPVMISRKLYRHSPLDCLPESLRPARNRSQLSPADRVFGWVSQACLSQENPAYRSQLRVGVFECETKNAVKSLNPPLVLPILAQPRPAQGRFYLGGQQGRAQPPGGTKEQRGYTDTNRVRGPKVYPHHSQFSLDRLKVSPHPAGNQNRSITGYVKEGTEFLFDLHLLNLSHTELAALVWLLSLPEDHFFRLGLGKPLGFGSVRVTIEPDDTCVADGKDWTASLANWDAKPQGIDLAPLVTEYETVMNRINASLLRSFLQIARGFGAVDVMYPPNPTDRGNVGDHFEWFAANERRREGAFSLPDPDDDNGPLLPINPS